jgi:hypothetical protein
MMIKISYGLLGLTFFLLISCNTSDSKQKESTVEAHHTEQPVQSFAPGTIVNHSSLESGSYTLYVPSSYSAGKKNSVLILLDPHGKGSFPISKYRGLADKFGLFLMASNDSKNGLPIEDCVNIVQRLLNECKQFPFWNGNVSLCGFSGGAKIALVAGNQITQFRSIIYCGAALPVQSLHINTPLLGIAGRKDMNYTEVENFSRWAASQVKVNGIFEWQGKHEWPDSTTFQYACYWHLLNSSENENAVNEFYAFNKELIDHEKLVLRKAELYSNVLSVLEGKMDVKATKNELRKVILSDEYKNARSEQQKQITLEEAAKQEILNSFESQDLHWWREKIKTLELAKTSSSERLLGYISLASWSYSTKAIEMNNLPFAMKVLDIYQMADPQNSEHEFLKATLQAKINNPDSAVYFLKEAVKLGLDDRSKIENDKNLAMLRGRNDFDAVLSSIK